MIDLGIVGSTRYGINSKISLENTYNMYVTDNCLVSYPGYKSVQTIPGLESRGIYASVKNNIMLHVIDSNVYRVTSSLSYEKVGNLETATGPVFITENNTQFCISDLDEIYIYEIGSLVRKANTQPGSPGDPFLAGYMDYQDDYFLCPNRLNNEWHISHLGDGDDWTALDSSTGLTYSSIYGTKPDTMMAVVAFNRQIFVMAQTGTEIWRDVGNTLFPYERDNSVAIDHGCISIESIAEGFNYVVWLSKNSYSNASIMYSTGGQPQPLRNDGIELSLQDLVYPESSTGFLFQLGDHIFYQITFYKDNLTLLYDFTTNRFYTVTDENNNFHIARKLVAFNNKNYFIGLPKPGETEVSLYELSDKYTTYDGKPIPQFRIVPPFRKPDASRFRMNSLTITMQQGTSQQEQTVGISLSTDGGISFGDSMRNTTNDRGYGANKMVFRQLGSANDATFKIEFWNGDADSLTDGYPEENGELNERFCVVGATLEVT